MTTKDTSVGRYISEWEINDNAAVGVILTRTREPQRLEDGLRKKCSTPSETHKTRKFKSWNVVSGWLDALKPRLETQGDNSVELYAALKKMVASKEDEETVHLVHYPHWVMKNHTGIIQLLKQIAVDFTAGGQRLILVAPEGFILPAELQNDIPVLDFDLPERKELESIYHDVLSSWTKTAIPKHTEHQIHTLIGSGSGMTAFEFETAFSKAIIQNADTFPDTPLAKLNEVILQTKTEVVKRSEVLELMESGSMDDIGGLDLAKDWIKKRKACFSQDAKEFGVDAPKGIVAIGPMGTGKTLFAKAIAGTLGVPLIKFDVAKIFGSLVGQSESRADAALKQLDAMSPCVALIDEVDKAGLSPKQGGGDSGTSMRVLGKLLTHMQESKKPIFWVFTANRAEGLDPALIRKGRMDEVFAVLPPNRVEREAVLTIHLKKRKQDPSVITDLYAAVEASKGFVSAEIEAAIKEAIIEAYVGGEKVTGRMIATQLNRMKPISVAFAEDFASMKNWAASNARMSSTPDTEETTDGEVKPTSLRKRAI